MNPFELATELTALNDVEIKKDKDSPKSVSQIESAVWGDENDCNMHLPVDGWNSRHWRRYFAMQYKLIFGHIYTGTMQTDRISLSRFIFKARLELGMNNTEIKEYIDWASENRMRYCKSIGTLYFIGNLLDSLPEYYNRYIHSKKNADVIARVKIRHLVIDNSDLRVEIGKYVEKDAHGVVLAVDPRLYMQFGIPNMVQYLTLQAGMTQDAAAQQISGDIKKVIKEDIAHFTQANGNFSPRFETVVKNSILWEPYAWKPIDWRNSPLRGLIKFFKFDDADWWRENPPLGIKPASCLKLLKARKKK